MADLRLDLNTYRVPTDGSFKLASIPTDVDEGLDKDDAKDQTKANIEASADLQERLWAEDKQSLLFVVQAMDTGGKDSLIRNVTRGLNPQGVTVTNFKAPTKEELEHDFLWRVHDHTPAKGEIALFNRSHYEDVLIVKVHGWAPPEIIERRYDHINDFEQLLADSGTTVVKIYLHISKDYQKERLQRRLRRPDKHWKFNPADLDERARWDDYMVVIEDALNRCSTEAAPWHVVPAQTRWYRDLLVSQLMLETLQRMDPQYPEPSFDISQYPPESIV
ncbi:MAG: polyphosphate kinase 2 family protein [Rhodothermales bacterium]